MVGQKLPFLLLLVILSVGCHRHLAATSGNRPLKPDPDASPLPVHSFICPSGKSVEVDDTGVLTVTTDGTMRFALVPRARLDGLLALLSSEQYERDLRAARQERGPTVCFGEPFIVIAHRARDLQYRFVLGDGTPSSIKSFVQILDSLVAEVFGPEH